MFGPAHLRATPAPVTPTAMTTIAMHVAATMVPVRVPSLVVAPPEPALSGACVDSPVVAGTGVAEVAGVRVGSIETGEPEAKLMVWMAGLVGRPICAGLVLRLICAGFVVGVGVGVGVAGEAEEAGVRDEGLPRVPGWLPGGESAAAG